MTIPTREFGGTGLNLPLLGLGAGQIGDARIPEDDAASFLNRVLDMGVSFIDTARMYGASEERIGRHLAHRRREFILSTKVGYDIPGHANWTHGCVSAGIDEALRRLRTDHIDIVHLHSCTLDVLREGEVIKALEDARRAGKIRVAAYSGENEALEFALESGRFQSIQTSVNLCDQRAITRGLRQAAEKNIGVIAKRPLANAPWRFAERPVGDYAEEYWVRWKAMGLEHQDFGADWDELALRFAAHLPGVGPCIVGTASSPHFQRNVEAIGKGPLRADVVAKLRGAFESNDKDWVGQI